MSNPGQKSDVSANIKIPYGLDFEDLKLAIDKDGDVCYDGGTIEKICLASGLEISHFTDGPPENLMNLIGGWYVAHRQHGGSYNPVAEEIFSPE
ncbi:MAG: hypothetical protein FWD51_06075 [Betaproteobacteria bacterium]|nr:hypothetical protein [Betaproteobacteria bacterium]